MAYRALMRAERWGLVSPGLAGQALWRKARSRSKANVGVLLAMIAAWGARDAAAWAQAVRAVI
jgi:hypothetical protein